MKSNDLKTTAGFQPIKTKDLQLPMDILDVKPASLRPNLTPDAFETATPSLYALRFFSSSVGSEAVKSRLSKSRVSQQSPESPSKEKNEIQLSPVELTINKKIKYPHDRKRHFGREKPQPVDLTPSDRELIEELRNQLRTQPRNGTTSVLEAIGDPEVREQRFYYEPLKTFLQGKDSVNKNYPDPGLRVVNIMIPSLEKGIHPESGIVLPLTLSRHNAAVSRNANRLRGGSTVTFLPKVEGNSLTTSQQGMVKFYHPEIPGHGRDPNVVSKRKTQFALPRIGLKRDEFDFEETAVYKRRKGIVTMSESRAKASTVQLPTSTEEDSFRNFNGFPRRATTTATGKAHLIGPMNKMDIIADYSRALQNGLISYNEYMKKVSVLSLHKVPLGKSAQRHFHLVRDGTTNMKPKLAHVDVSSKSGTHISSGSSDHSDGTKIQRPGVTREKAKTSQFVHFASVRNPDGSESNDLSNKHLQSQVHRVDIGEGLSLFEKPKHSPDLSDELIVPDLARYTHVHHPRPGKLPQYHWNHESAFGTGAETWSNKHWPSSVTAKVPNKIHSSLRNLEAAKEDRNETQSKTKVLLSMEEYLKMQTQTSTDSTTKIKQKNDVLGSGRLEETSLALTSTDVINLAEENFDYIGKISEPLTGAEPTGLGAREILRSVNLKLPANAIPREDLEGEEPSDIDSVFQEHLDNMMKTIKKAKSNNKKKVPELRGLVPTVIPQVLVDNMNSQENLLEVETKNEEDFSSLGLLDIHRNLPKNSPPPTAGENVPAKKESLEKTAAVASTKPTDDQSQPHAVPVTSISNVPTTERLGSQPVKDKEHPQPKTPRSVQSERSTGLVIPTVVLDEAPHSLINNSEVRIMTASVDLTVPSGDDEMEGAMTDRSRLEVTITSMPVAPPSSVAASSDESAAEDEAD